MNKVIKNNWQLYKLYLKWEPIYCCARLFASFLSVVQPLSSIFLFQIFLDAILVEKQVGKGIIIALIAATVNFFVSCINWVINNRLTPISEQKNIMKFTKKLLELYLKTDMDTIETTEFYNKYSQVINDVSSRMMAVQNTICNLVGNILSLLTILTLMTRVSPVMIVVSLLGVVANLIVAPIMNKLGYLSYLEKTPYERKQGYIKRVFYIVDYAKELKIYNICDKLTKEYDIASNSLIKVVKKYSKKFVGFGVLISALQCISFGGVLCYLAYGAVHSGWTAGVVAAMYNASEELKGVIATLFQTIPMFDENSRYIENYNELLATKSKIEIEDDNGKNVNNFEKVEFTNVSFSYKGNTDKALDNINFELRKKEKVAFVGKNGAGKSTFVNLLLRLYDPTEGIITINGEEYTKCNKKSLRNNYMAVLQDCKFYAMSIAENILLREVKSEEDEILVWDALKKVGMYEYIKSLEFGINTIVTKEFDDKGIMLSGGQMQKLLLARVFVSEAPVIILDEISSAMDAISEKEIFEMIEDFVIDKTVIYISHRLSTTKTADKIYLFDDGKIVEEGTHNELMIKKQKYYEMFTAQAEKYID